MLELFAPHNQFKESIARFRVHDPHLRRLAQLPFVYQSPLVHEPSFRTPGVYLLTGGRQIGKTTLLKQLILSLLTDAKTNPERILFLTGELIDTHHILRRIVERFQKPGARQYLMIDEVNYIPDWDKSIKYLADTGALEQMVVLLTGSDSQIIKMAMKRFAGRRGKSEKVNFIFHPLSFCDFVTTKDRALTAATEELIDSPLRQPIRGYEKTHKALMRHLSEYLLHGGYLPAINDLLMHKSISKATIDTYVDWITGDILKHNKGEHYLYEIFRGIQTTYGSQVSWNSLAAHLSIDHHQTVIDYCRLLESIHVLNIVEALREHKLTGAPKKNRKLYFRDPFIYHSVCSRVEDAFSFEHVKARTAKPACAASLVETVAIDHCKRWLPTYYIKGAKGEVDIALVRHKKFHPIEVKWTTQIRAEDLKQIARYPNGIILGPRSETRTIANSVLVPFVRFLVQVSRKQFEP